MITLCSPLTWYHQVLGEYRTSPSHTPPPYPPTKGDFWDPVRSVCVSGPKDLECSGVSYPSPRRNPRGCPVPTGTGSPSFSGTHRGPGPGEVVEKGGTREPRRVRWILEKEVGVDRGGVSPSRISQGQVPRVPPLRSRSSLPVEGFPGLPTGV